MEIFVSLLAVVLAFSCLVTLLMAGANDRRKQAEVKRSANKAPHPDSQS